MEPEITLAKFVVGILVMSLRKMADVAILELNVPAELRRETVNTI